MPETIRKVTERHTAGEIMKRDGETYIAVGLFLVALGIPVLAGTIWALSQPRAAVVNAICGVALLAIGGAAIGYGWLLYKKSSAKPS